MPRIETTSTGDVTISYWRNRQNPQTLGWNNVLHEMVSILPANYHELALLHPTLIQQAKNIAINAAIKHPPRNGRPTCHNYDAICDGTAYRSGMLVILQPKIAEQEATRQAEALRVQQQAARQTEALRAQQEAERQTEALRAQREAVRQAEALRIQQQAVARLEEQEKTRKTIEFVQQEAPLRQRLETEQQAMFEQLKTQHSSLIVRLQFFSSQTNQNLFDEIDNVVNAQETSLNQITTKHNAGLQRDETNIILLSNATRL